MLFIALHKLVETVIFNHQGALPMNSSVTNRFKVMRMLLASPALPTQISLFGFA